MSAESESPVYRSEVSVTYDGADVHAVVPELEQPVTFGLHGDIASHYGVPADGFTPAPATLDFLVAALASCMTGTLGDALAARGIGFAWLTARAHGSVVDERGVLVLRAVSVRYRLACDLDRREEIERVHAVHARACPMHRSVCAAIAVESDLELERG